MFDFKRLSIRNKLMAIMLLTTGSVLALATLVMVVNEALTLERSTRQQLAALADVIAASARGPMSLSDPVTAYDMLEALRSKGNIVYAQLRNPDGSVFAEFRREHDARIPDYPPPGDSETGVFQEAGQLIHYQRPVLLEWRRVGTLQLAADTAVQLQGARGYSKDTVAEWIYRYARQARLVDGASEVHEMVIAREWREQGLEFWS